MNYIGGINGNLTNIKSVNELEDRLEAVEKKASSAATQEDLVNEISSRTNADNELQTAIKQVSNSPYVYVLTFNMNDGTTHNIRFAAFVPSLVLRSFFWSSPAILNIFDPNIGPCCWVGMMGMAQIMVGDTTKYEINLSHIKTIEQMTINEEGEQIYTEYDAQSDLLLEGIPLENYIKLEGYYSFIATIPV